MKLTSKLFAAIACLALAWGGVACSDDDDPADGTTLAKPVLSQQNVTKTSFVVTWPAVPNAGSYAYTVNDGAQKTVTATALEETGLESGKTYVVKVKAVPADTETYRESAWASITVTTTAGSGVVEGGDIELPSGDNLNFSSSDFNLVQLAFSGRYFLDQAQTKTGDLWDLYLYKINAEDVDIYSFDLAFLSKAETDNAEFVGTYPMLPTETLEAGYLLPGMIDDSGLYYSWYLPSDPENPTENFYLDEITPILSGTLSIADNGDETYTIDFDLGGYYNLTATSESDLKVRTIKGQYTGKMGIFDLSQEPSSVKMLKNRDYKSYTFTDINAVAWRSQLKRIR